MNLFSSFRKAKAWKLKAILMMLVIPTPNGLFAQQVFPMQAQQVAANVYAIVTPVRELPNPQNRGWNSNSAFVVTPSGVLLFDTGSSAEIGQSLRSTIATVTDKPVRWIINSHAHGDHWLGNIAFSATVEKIFATETAINRIHADGQSWVERFNRMTKGISGDTPITPPTNSINSRTEMTLGGMTMVLFPSDNSHSPGDLLLWLPDSRVLISGDVIYSDRMPSTNDSNLQHWMTLLTELERLQPAVVIPGHGKVTDLGGITRLHALFTTLWQAVAKGLEAGKTDYEMLPDVSKALAGFRQDYPGLDEKLRRDLPHVYLQVETASF